MIWIRNVSIEQRHVMSTAVTVTDKRKELARDINELSLAPSICNGKDPYTAASNGRILRSPPAMMVRRWSSHSTSAARTSFA